MKKLIYLLLIIIIPSISYGKTHQKSPEMNAAKEEVKFKEAKKLAEDLAKKQKEIDEKADKEKAKRLEEFKKDIKNLDKKKK